MIEDLDASIKALLEYELADIHPNLGISFETPDDDFPSGVVTTPAVDLFLYDIRENLELRHNETLYPQRGFCCDNGADARTGAGGMHLFNHRLECRDRNGSP